MLDGEGTAQRRLDQPAEVRALAFTRCSRGLLVGSADGIRFWDVLELPPAQ